MRRINTDTKAPDLFGPGKDGFSNGNDQGAVNPTQLSADFCNDVQESIARAVEMSEPLGTHGDMDLAQSIHRPALFRKPRADITLDRWSSFQTHADSGTPGTWRFYERTLVASHQPDNIGVTLSVTPNGSDLPNNSRMWIDVHAICVDDVDIDAFHMVVMRGIAKKSGNVVQGFIMTTVNTENVGGLTVTWGVQAVSSNLTVNATIPVFIGSFFNILAHVQIRCVTLT
jgi:hypothetical protein